MAGKAKTHAPEELTPDQKRRLWKWVQGKYTWLTAEQVREEVEACLEFHQSKGNLYVDWVKVCQTWIRRRLKEERGLAPPPASTLAAVPRSELERNERKARKASKARALEEREKLGPLGLEALMREARQRAGV